jgi:putative DNA modification/repair radical SAM protein
MSNRVLEKLQILADAAKYDVSCASSGSKRKNHNNGLGNAEGMGICHTYTQDGRCVSLLKILLTNHCIYDCAYCISRKSNDVKRAAFTVQEVVDLTINFYRRNYIEGLFLSSGIFKSADYTMERLCWIAKKLRTEEKFNGYIHLKAIPGASRELIDEAARYADRLSVNLEIPSEKSLKLIAPEKNYKDAYTPMGYLKEGITEYKKEAKKVKKTPLYAPAGQSTQLVIGASPESDYQILNLSSELYQHQQLKRVYYSAYIPVSEDNRLPAIQSPPLKRENRLYQADWLMRFYGFQVDEIIDEQQGDLELDFDPKMAWALRNPQFFPVNIQKATKEELIRVPGLGIKTALLIIKARRFGKIRSEQVRKMGLAWNRAKYFLSGFSDTLRILDWQPAQLRNSLLLASQTPQPQLSLF